MNCLLMRELPLGGIIRLWDTYLSEADGFGVLHLYTSAALLSTLSPQIQAQADFAETFTFLLNPPTISACCYLLFLCACSADEHAPPTCMFHPWASVWCECPLQLASGAAALTSLSSRVARGLTFFSEWGPRDIALLLADAYRLKYTFEGAQRHLSSSSVPNTPK
jgi:hypothetical protein